MKHQPKHGLVRTVQRMRWRTRALAISAAAVGALAGGMVIAAPGQAATSLQVTLSACGTGASAVWNTAGTPVLTVGTAPGGTCGAPAGTTYNPSYAQVSVNGVAGTATPAPADAPSFTTDHYAAGSPRWVLELHNGHSLWGYPPNSGLNGTSFAWAVDNGNTYESYATAYNDAGGASTTVDSAFVVEDADQAAGTADTITGLSYGSNTLPAGADIVTVTAPAAQTSTEGTAITPVQVKAVSSKGDAIASFSAAGLPAGLTIDSSTGVISGTPSISATPGQYPVKVTATDNGGTSGTSASFTWTVAAKPTSPPPPTATVGDEVNAYGNGFDVFKQHYAVNAVIAGWPATQHDVATHFQRVAEGAGFRFEAVSATGATGLCVSDPGFDAAGTGVKDGLVLRSCNTGAWQEFVPQADGTLKDKATGLVVNPDGTGAQLRGGVSATSWGGSKYSWKTVSQLPS